MDAELAWYLAPCGTEDGVRIVCGKLVGGHCSQTLGMQSVGSEGVAGGGGNVASL